MVVLDWEQEHHRTPSGEVSCFRIYLWRVYFLQILCIGQTLPLYGKTSLGETARFETFESFRKIGVLRNPRLWYIYCVIHLLCNAVYIFCENPWPATNGPLCTWLNIIATKKWCVTPKARYHHVQSFFLGTPIFELCFKKSFKGKNSRSLHVSTVASDLAVQLLGYLNQPCLKVPLRVCLIDMPILCWWTSYQSP